MKLVSRIVSFFSGRKLRIGLLIAAWCLGGLLGAAVFLDAKDVYVSWMLGAFSGSVSIVSVWISAALPLSITALAVMYSKPFLIYILCFCKSALYCICVMACYGAYGSAGWLAQFILLFSDQVVILALLLMWIHSLWDESKMRESACVLSFVICTFFAVLHTFWISPFSGALQIS